MWLISIYNILMRSEVLGLPVDIITKEETLRKISEWIRVGGNRPKMIVTAYSEFYVNAQNDKEFASIIKKADMVTPDGVSVLAAVEYIKKTQKLKNSHQQLRSLGGQARTLEVLKIIRMIGEGVKIGGKIISGKMGETVTGVWMFEQLTKMAEKKGWKIFLLGGWGNVSGRTATMLLERFPNIKVAYDPGEDRVGTDETVNDKVIKKINAFKPDIIFVQYNPVKQEKWISKNLLRLKVKVAMGVGGTFDEFVGDFKKAPVVMETMGLKWLWRLMVQPKRFGRIFRAVIIFPWLIFRKSLR